MQSVIILTLVMSKLLFDMPEHSLLGQVHCSTRMSSQAVVVSTYAYSTSACQRVISSHLGCFYLERKVLLFATAE